MAEDIGGFLVDGHAVLIVVAGDAKIDNPKYKAQFGTKAKMLTPDEVETLVGHAVGGVCPFGVNEGVTVYLDESLKRFSTVFPACGSRNSAIALSIAELEKYSGIIYQSFCQRATASSSQPSASYPVAMPSPWIP